MSANGTWPSTITTSTSTTPTIATPAITPVIDQPTPATSVMAEGTLLATLTAEQQRVNVAVVGVLTLIILVGVVGNSFVLAVYRPRSGALSTSPAILFILVMAGLDLASCMLSVPYEMLDLLRPYNNDNVPLCQAARFLTTAVSQSRGLMLLCVAWDRYLKICLPLTIYTNRHAKAAVMTVMVLGILLSWPQIPLNGQVTIQTHMPHVLATDCNIVHHLPAVYSLLYHGVLYVLFVISFVMYGMLYGRIFYVLWKNGWIESSTSSGSRQRESEVAFSVTPRAARQSLNRSANLELCRLCHEAMDSAEVPCRQNDCARKFSDVSLRDKDSSDLHSKDLREVGVGDGLQTGRDVIRPVEGSREKNEFGFNYRTNACSKKNEFSFNYRTNTCSNGGPSKMETSVEDLERSSLNKTIVDTSYIGNGVVLSPFNTTCGQSLTNRPRLSGSYLLTNRSFREDTLSTLKSTHSKEKHPRAKFQLKCAKTISGVTRSPAGLRRSQSLPCCGKHGDSSLSPLLRHCCTSSDFVDSLITSKTTHNKDTSTVSDTRTDVQRHVAMTGSKPSVKVDTSKQCLVHTDDREQLSSHNNGQKEQLPKNHSQLSLADCTSVTDAGRSPSLPGLKISSEFQTGKYGNNETCLSSKTFQSRAKQMDCRDSHHDAHDFQQMHCITAVKSCCEATEHTDKVQGSDIVKQNSHRFIAKADCCKRSAPFEQNRCQLCSCFSSTSRTGCNIAVISTKDYRGLLRKWRKDGTQKQEISSDNNMLTPPKTVHTGHRDKRDEISQNENVSTGTNPKSLQDIGLSLPLSTLPSTAESRQQSSLEGSECRHPPEKGVTQKGSLKVTKPSTSPTIIVTKGSPTGAARIAENCTGDVASTTLYSRTGETSQGQIRRHGGKRLRLGKTTVMLAMVTLSTVMCYVPFLTVIVMRTSGTRFQKQTSSTGDLVYKFCIRSFFISNVVNPFVYIYVNPRFRRKVRAVFCRISRCLLQLKVTSQSEISSPLSDT